MNWTSFILATGLLVSSSRTRGDYAIDWHTIGAGGASVGGTVSLVGSIGILDLALNTGDKLSLEDGFWPGIVLPPDENWLLRATNGPSPRFGNAMAYDSVRGVTVLFGGRKVSDDRTHYDQLGDLWEWDGNHWLLRMPSSPTAGWHQVTGGYWSPDAGDLPVARHLHAMAYDSRRARVVLFGGAGLTPDGGFDFPLRDTWEWDGLRWEFKGMAGPAARINPAMAYDPGRGVTVMTGGFDIPDPGTVWEWDGTVWRSIASTGGPALNYNKDGASMVYDSAAHETVFGPTSDGFHSSFFWGWNGRDWHPRASDFGPPLFNITPPYGSVVYDESRQQLVYFGGQYGHNGGNITAFLDRFGGWRLVDSARSSSFARADLLDGPALLTTIVAHGDPISKAVWNQFPSDVQDSLSDPDSPIDQKLTELIKDLNKLVQSTSFYDPSLFPTLPTEAHLLDPIRPYDANLIRFNRLLLEQAYPTQIAKSPSVPSGRMRLGAAYDSRRHALVVMGGEYDPNDIVKLNGGETWELIGPDKLEIDEQPSSISRNAGDPGGFHVGARAPAGETLTYQWFFEDHPLSDDARILGSHSDTLRIDTVRTTDVGRYYAGVSAGSQSLQSQTAILTLAPTLSIISLPADFHLVWGDPAVVLEHTDDVGSKWTPVPGASSPFRISGSGPAKYFRTRPTPSNSKKPSTM